MKKREKERLDLMRRQGKKASEIALELHISVNTVRSYMRRHPMDEYEHRCKCCGRPVFQPPGRKPKLFCSDKCRMKWWNSHRDVVNKKAYHTFTCGYCGKEFTAYANNTRKYCSRECYFKRGAWGLEPQHNALPHGDCFDRQSLQKRRDFGEKL